MKNFIQILAIGCLLLALVFAGYYYWRQNKLEAITDFQSCADAGYPVAESYPRQCHTPDGRGFTEEIEDGTMCTMEVRECPDGSYVGRQAPDCEFAACPMN